jgi:ribosomal protein S18 acetylase RimI-like enzyme
MTTENLIIRRATSADAEAMAALLASIQEENLDTIRRSSPRSEAEQRELLEGVDAKGRAFFLVAVSVGEVIGLLDLWGGEKPYNCHAARFEVSVHKFWRGRGVAKDLTEAAVREARLWPNFCRIELECAAHNDSAIHLYESLGFVTEGRKRKSMDLGKGPEDMLLMALVW